MTPQWRREDVPLMPKQRYAIMRAYMPKVGTRGLDMMFRTCTVQTNFDFSSEADMVQKLRVALAFQPLITALFANSPFTDGKPNGFLSARSEIWLHTDPDRTGILPFAFESGMGFERYVDYALDVPMYFVKRGEKYHDVAGASFRDLLKGKLPQLPGERATLSDWANHLTTIFPEVRLKRYLEMRGADVGPRPFLYALPAFTVGLMYDANALDAAWQIAKGWSADERAALRQDVPRRALDANIAGRSLRDIGREILPLVRQGLVKRAKTDGQGRDESRFLEPLEAVLAGRTQAEELLAKYEGAWKRSVDPAFTECAF
jgi:glutamate--cysteine ligase